MTLKNLLTTYQVPNNAELVEGSRRARGPDENLVQSYSH